MAQEMLNSDMLSTLALPLLFAISAGLWIYRHRAAQRPQLLLSLCLLFAVAAYGYAQQPQPTLFALLLAFMLMLSGMMLHHWEAVKLPVRRK